jgi:Domain of unknown function (DUF397)
MEATEGIKAMDGPDGSDGLDGIEEESRVEVEITYDTSAAPHKADEPYLYVMYDAAKPDAGKLYFTQAEWDAFVLGVRDGEFDLDEDGNLPPVPENQHRPEDGREDDREGEAEDDG